MTDVVGTEYELIFDRSFTGDELSELLKATVGDSRHYRAEAQQGRMIDLGTSSDSLVQHARLVPGSNVLDHFYPDGNYASVRIRAVRWPSQMLNDKPYHPADHVGNVVLLARQLATNTGGSTRQVKAY